MIVVSETVSRAIELGDGVGDEVTVLDAVTVDVGLDAVGVQPIAIATTSASADRRAIA